MSIRATPDGPGRCRTVMGKAPSAGNSHIQNLLSLCRTVRTVLFSFLEKKEEKREGVVIRKSEKSPSRAVRPSDQLNPREPRSKFWNVVRAQVSKT